MGRLASEPGALHRDVSAVRDRLGSYGQRKLPIDPSMNPRQRGLIEDMHRRRTAAAGTDALLAPPKQRDPFRYWNEQRHWFEDLDNDEFYERLSRWTRLLYRTHPLVPSLIDIFSRFPLLEISFEHKDERLVDFYSTLFLDGLDYNNLLFDMSREKWVTGEANTIASWHDGIGSWESEDILNPLDVQILSNVIMRDETYAIKVPDSIKELVNRQSPKAEYEALLRMYPDVVNWARQNKPIPVSNVLLKRLKFRTDPWSKRGTPILLRAFRQLMMEESLYAAQDAIADRFYSPLILARLGLDNVDEAGPWLPDPEELDSLRNDLNLALMSDMRLLVYHHGLDIKSVFGKEQMPKFSDEFDRIDVQLMSVFGIGPELIRGGASNVPYASGALNRELVTQLLQTHQYDIKQFVRSRMEPIAERQGLYEYEKRGDIRVPIMETVLVYDEETGEEWVEERPKLAIPDIHFKAMDLRDEKVERSFILELKQAGFPVSFDTLKWNLDIEFLTENEKYNDERLELIVAEQQFKKSLFERIQKQHLPIPADYADEYNAWLKGLPAETSSDVTLPGPPGAGATPGTPPPPSIDPSEFANAVPVNPDNPTRPEISDEMRAGMPAPVAASRTASVRKESVLDEAVSQELTENMNKAPAEPAIYGGRMKFGTPVEFLHRRKMALPEGIRVATPEEATFYGADWEALYNHYSEEDEQE